MTLQQQLKYAAHPQGWHRFNFQLYLKYRSEKLSRELKQEAQLLGVYKRPQQSIIN